MTKGAIVNKEEKRELQQNKNIKIKVLLVKRDLYSTGVCV